MRTTSLVMTLSSGLALMALAAALSIPADANNVIFVYVSFTLFAVSALVSGMIRRYLQISQQQQISWQAFVVVPLQRLRSWWPQANTRP